MSTIIIPLDSAGLPGISIPITVSTSSPPKDVESKLLPRKPHPVCKMVDINGNFKWCPCHRCTGSYYNSLSDVYSHGWTDFKPVTENRVNTFLAPEVDRIVVQRKKHLQYKEMLVGARSNNIPIDPSPEDPSAPYYDCRCDACNFARSTLRLQMPPVVAAAASPIS